MIDYIYDTYSVDPNYSFQRDDVTCMFRHIDTQLPACLKNQAKERIPPELDDGVKADWTILREIRTKNRYRKADEWDYEIHYGASCMIQSDR